MQNYVFLKKCDIMITKVAEKEGKLWQHQGVKEKFIIREITAEAV